jgi:hypothetical protein
MDIASTRTKERRTRISQISPIPQKEQLLFLLCKSVKSENRCSPF